MGILRLDRVIEFLTSMELFLGLLWTGLAAVSIALLILMRTRWGQSRPLRKCLVLSLLAHLLLAGYATTVQICSAGPRRWGAPTARVSLVDAAESDDPAESPSRPEPWEQFAESDVAEPVDGGLTALSPVETPADQPQRIDELAPSELSEDPELDHLGIPQPDERQQAAPEPVEPHPALARQPETLEPPKAQRREPSPLPVPVEEPAGRQPIATQADLPERDADAGATSAPLDSSVSSPRAADEAGATESDELVRDVIDSPLPGVNGKPARPTAAPGAEGGPAQEVSTPQPAGPHAMPETYRLRTAPDRASQAQRQGATPESEAAVRGGLAWLAAAQEPDGRWNASRHGAGRETSIDGQNRQGAGIRADTGITGLALLAFLAAGHTHQQGEYQDNVRRGLEFLMVSQRANGSLSGDADFFAAMYCHAMATFALSEDYGMTGDARLHWPVRRAINYIVASQDPRGGGWRYSPSSPGDTSQLGWQLMALRSAELAGIPIAASTREGALRFLASVSHGRNGGLASYRPAERDTRPMTAEALVCRQLLGMPPESPTAAEAADFLLGERPGEGRFNLYYWYYSTLALYQVSGEHFARWNEALQKDLVARQCDSGTLEGSWDPDEVWGAHGGRVYSTALATLCLEVYYRYLPRYLETAGRQKNVR